MDLPPSYEEDIYAWSQRQAAVLRRMAADPARPLPNDLDIRNVIEEIETVGRSELASVRSHLTRMLEHIVKAVSSPEAYPARMWMGEVAREQTAAARRFAPGMRQNLEVDEAWADALRLAGVDLEAYGETLAPLPGACPFALQELLDTRRRPKEFVDRLAAALPPPAAA
jgi:hypothetical protein